MQFYKIALRSDRISSPADVLISALRTMATQAEITE